MTNKIEEKKERIDALSQEITEYLGKETMSLQYPLKHLSDLFSNRVYWSEMLSLIAENTVPGVYFLSFSGEAEKKSIALQGRATNYTTLAKQIVAFREVFGGVEFSTSGIDKGGGINVSFTLDFSKKDKRDNEGRESN
jgi:Tfp pilus assembly protein PilN